MRVREARQGAIHFEHVTDGDDALRGVGAPAILVDPAGLVVVQAGRQRLSKKQARSGGIDSKAVGCSERILELLEGGVGGDGVGHVLCPLLFERVVPKATYEGQGKTLRGC